MSIATHNPLQNAFASFYPSITHFCYFFEGNMHNSGVPIARPAMFQIEVISLVSIT